MSETYVLSVAGMTCAHCERAVREELAAVPGVDSVHVGLESGRVVVIGAALDDQVLRAAVDEAGYEVV